MPERCTRALRCPHVLEPTAMPWGRTLASCGRQLALVAVVVALCAATLSEILRSVMPLGPRAAAVFVEVSVYFKQSYL